MTIRSACRIALIAGGFALIAGGAFAQSPSSKMPGFSQNRGQPINITAQSLEVRDKEKIATFEGKVRAVQGDAVLETAKLIVFYEGDASGAGSSNNNAAVPGNGQIKRLEAKGGVVLTQKDQTAVGDDAVYDMKSNTVTLTGNVTATKGESVIRGHRMVVDMNTGQMRVDPLPGQSVSTIFKPNDQAKPDKPKTPAAQPQRTPASSGNRNGSSANRPAHPAPRRDASQPMPLRQ